MLGAGIALAVFVLVCGLGEVIHLKRTGTITLTWKQLALVAAGAIGAFLLMALVAMVAQSAREDRLRRSQPTYYPPYIPPGTYIPGYGMDPYGNMRKSPWDHTNPEALNYNGPGAVDRTVPNYTPAMHDEQYRRLVMGNDYVPLERPYGY